MHSRLRERQVAALANTVGDKVEAAYRRGDLLEKRVQMMADWADFCAVVERPPNEQARVGRSPATKRPAQGAARPGALVRMH